MKGSYGIGDVVLNNWKLVRLIGEGSFGQVYEAERVDFGITYKAAIKIIRIPQSDSEVKSARAESVDQESVTAYFRGLVEELIQEFVLMSKLKGNSNVVSYEDHTVIERQGEIGWDIVIRMELLTPLIDYVQSRKLTRRDVIRLGIDICKALELCQKYNIVHRDIKPENIFVSDTGNFKLGDFGIARTVEKTTGGLSKKGTYTYMAPEVYRDAPYNSSVDMYSLGIVMYRLLNENRAPFLPDYPAPITHHDRENALAKRISGAKMPTPKNADGRLAEIVLKACAFQPKDRYSSPMQMRQELEAILYENAEAAIIYPAGDETPQRSGATTDRGAQAVAAQDIRSQAVATTLDNISEQDGGTVNILNANITPPVQEEQRPEETFAPTVESVPVSIDKKKKGRKLLIPVACAAIAVFIIIALIMGHSKSGYNEISENEMMYIDGDGIKHYILKNEESVELESPERTLEPETIYQELHYGPEMFHADYRVLGDKDAVLQQQQEMDFIEWTDYDHILDKRTTYDVASIPCEIHGPGYSFLEIDHNDMLPEGYSLSDVLELRVYDKKGNIHFLDGVFEINGHTLKVTLLKEKEVNKETPESPQEGEPESSSEYDETTDISSTEYELSNLTLEYEFEFQGPSLSLSRGGKSATLYTGYIYGDEPYIRFSSDGHLNPDSPRVDKINQIEYIWDRDEYGCNQWFYIIYEDRDGYEQINRTGSCELTEDGLITFTVAYDEGTLTSKTYQYVYILVRDGLILTDGEEMYYYNLGDREYDDLQYSDAANE